MYKTTTRNWPAIRIKLVCYSYQSGRPIVMSDTWFTRIVGFLWPRLESIMSGLITRAVLSQEDRAMPLLISIPYVGVSNFTTASCGFSATTWLSCCLCLQTPVNYPPKSEKSDRPLVLERTSQIAYLTQTSSHVITLNYYGTTVIIIHRQRSIMVVINRTRTDSCENARVLLLLVRQ